MKKFVMCLAIVWLIGSSAFAATSGDTSVKGSVRITKYTAKVATESATIWSTTALAKRAYVDNIVVSAVAASILTITDNDTTPNTLLVVRVPAGETVVVPVNTLIGSKSTTIAASASIKASCDVVTAVNITLQGWER